MLCVGIFVMWCHATPAAPPAGNYCDIVKVVHPHPTDTRKTKAALWVEYKKWKALCGGRK